MTSKETVGVVGMAHICCRLILNSSRFNMIIANIYLDSLVPGVVQILISEFLKLLLIRENRNHYLCSIKPLYIHVPTRIKKVGFGWTLTRTAINSYYNR